MKKRASLKWYWVMLLQGLIFFICASVCVFVPFVLTQFAQAAERAIEVALLPLAGGFAAYIATRMGVNNYAAWILPPLIMPATYFLFTGAPPYYVGGIFICALVTIIGASAGEVVNMRAKARNERWRGNT